MRFFDYIRTAFRNLARQKARTFLTILAVVVGAISVVIMLSLVVSAKQTALEQMEKLGQLTLVTVSPSPDIDNYNSSGDAIGTKLDDTIVEQVRALPHVVAVSPSVGLWEFETMELKDGNGKKVRPNFAAYEPAEEFNPEVVAGRQLNTNDIAQIILSGEALRSFGYDKNPDGIIGKTVLLRAKGQYSGYGVTPEKPPANADEKWWGEQQKKIVTIEATIVGTQSQGLGGGENYITMAWARKVMTRKFWKYDESKKQQIEEQRRQYDEQMQQLKEREKRGERVTYPEAPQFDESNNMILDESNELETRGYGSILLKVDDTANVESVAEGVRKLNLGARTAKEILEGITKAFTVASIILGAIGLIALVVASIGIINTMVMAIYERTREIGVMRACGATRGTVRRLFTFEAALLGFFGGVIGLAVSYGLALIGNSVINSIAADQSVDVQIVLSFPLWLIIGVLAFTTLVGLLAGIYPAFKAARLNPVEALRYE